MLRKLIDYLVLPPEMTSFERTYLLKINKIDVPVAQVIQGLG